MLKSATSEIIPVGLITTCKIILGFFVLKLSGSYLTAAEFGVLGQFMTLVAIVNMISSAGISTGLTSALCKFKSPLSKDKLIAASIKNSFVVFVVTLLSVLFFGPQISYFFFDNRIPLISIYLFPLIGLFSALAAIVQSVLIEKKRTFTLLILNVSGSVLGGITFGSSIYFNHLNGAIWGSMLLITINGLLSILLWKNTGISSIVCLARYKTYRYQRYLLPFCISTLFGSLFFPMALISIRTIISKQVNWQIVGEWTAVLRISDAYMQFLGLLLVAYVLPKFSRLRSQPDQHIKMLVRMMLEVTCIFLPILIFVFVAKKHIFKIIFNYSTTDIDQLFMWQVAGDLIRCEFSILVYFWLSQSNTKLVMINEVAQGLIILCSYSLISISVPGSITAVQSYFLTYTILLFLGFIVTMKSIIHKKKSIKWVNEFP